MKQRINRRWIFSALVGIAVICAGSTFILQQQTPEYLRQRLLSSLRESCPDCKIELASMELNILEGKLVLNDFLYIDSLDHHSQIDVRARRIEIITDPRHLLPGQTGPLILHAVQAENVDFTLAEDPSIKSAPDNSPALSGLPPMVFEKISVTDSVFRYDHKVTPLHASLLLTGVSGTVGPWSTRRELAQQYSPAPTSIDAQGILENSGTFEVKAEVDPLSTLGSAHIRVEVKNQPFSAVDAFFRAECGVGLEGQLLDAATDLKMDEGKIDGTLSARYTKLKIQVVDKNNSGIKNFFETLGAKFIMTSEQGLNGKAAGEKSFHDQRTHEQSIFSALFHGLGKAASALVKG